MNNEPNQSNQELSFQLAQTSYDNNDWHEDWEYESRKERQKQMREEWLEDERDDV